MRLTFVLFSMSQVRSAKRVCKERGRKAYYLTKSRNDLPTREWMYRDGAARKVLGECDFVFDDDLNRYNLLKIAVTADELREVNVREVCVQPLDGDEFTVHVDVAACRISDLKSQIRANNCTWVPLRTAVVPDELEFWIGFSQTVVRRERFYCL